MCLHLNIQNKLCEPLLNKLYSMCLSFSSGSLPLSFEEEHPNITHWQCSRGISLESSKIKGSWTTSRRSLKFCHSTTGLHTHNFNPQIHYKVNIFGVSGLQQDLPHTDGHRADYIQNTDIAIDL